MQHRTYLSLVRYTMLGIVLLCVKFGAAQQEINLDGFVTDPPSEHFLKVSKFTINVSPDTQCSRYEPEYGRYFFINKTTLIAESCDKSNVSVGSRVTVVGELTTSDTVRASKILVGESFERPTSLPKTDGERLDWRLDDRYSGAPWEHTEGGGAFVEEGPETSTPQAPIIAHWWINGFPLTITSATTTFLRSKRSSTDSMLFMPNNMGGVLIDNHRKVRAPTFPLPQTRLPLYVSYEASRGDHEEPVATDLHLYSYDAVRGEQKFVDGYRASVQEPDYAKHLDGKIQYKDGAEIEIIADEHLQNYVCGGLKEVIPETWRTQDPFRNLLRCFVVKPFKNVPGKFYEQFNGEPTVWTRGRSTNGDLVYKVPAGVSSIDQVIAMPDGLILIPDSELPRFQNKAQLEFVLSAAVTAIVQRAAYFIRREDSADPAPSTMDGYDELQKIIRLAIRQMYLSGYDIREAPFAWALATGAKSQNPILNATSNDDIPWYASYAFDYMSRYYRNVDYTALKRDEAEYQHFLKDLHSSDPGAFTSKPVE